MPNPGHYRQYRIRFTANQVKDQYGSFLQFGEIEFFEKIEADFAADYETTQQTSHLDGVTFRTEEGTAFDTNDTAAGRVLVCSGAAANYEFDVSFAVTLPRARTLRCYSIRGADNKDRCPGTWRVEGRNGDDEEWAVVDTREGVTWADSNKLKYFPVPSAGTYAQYRVRITAAAGDSRWSGDRFLEFNEISLFQVWGLDDARVVDTTEDAAQPGVLEISPAAGECVNDSVALQGNLKVVKTGAGTLRVARVGQSYTGGTDIQEGQVVMACEPNKLPFGGTNVIGSIPLWLRAGASLDLNGYQGWGIYHLFQDGGTLVGGSGQPTFTWELTADSAVDLTRDFASAGTTYVPIDLGGHTLSVATTQKFYPGLRGAVNGTFDLVAGWFATPSDGVTEMRTASIVQHEGSLRLDGEICVSNYTSYATHPHSAGTGPLKVFGTFSPQGTAFWAPTLQDGSTIDLSMKDSAWSTTTAEISAEDTQGRTTVSYESGATVTIDLGARAPALGDQILAWDALPEGVTFVFKNDETPASQTAEGLFYGGDPESPVVTSAVWTNAAGDGDVNNPANWTCTNAMGYPVANGLPGSVTTVYVRGDLTVDLARFSALSVAAVVLGDVALKLDSDWTSFDVGQIPNGVTIDLEGHLLKVQRGDETSPTAFTVTDSVGGGVFEFHVAEGQTFVNTKIALAGALQFVKKGAGCFRVQKTGQSYTGGNKIAEGLVELYIPGMNNTEFAVSRNTLGWTDPDKVVRPRLEVCAGATLDMRGNYGLCCLDLVRSGGTLANRGFSQTDHATKDSVGNLTLTADSFIEIQGENGCIAFRTGLVDLGGYTLTATVGSSNDLTGLIFYEPLTNGTLRVTTEMPAALYFRPAVSMDLSTLTIDTDSTLQIRNDVQLGALVCKTLSTVNDKDGKKTVFVKRAFAPETDYFPNVQLQDGSTLDLSQRTTALSLASGLEGLSCTFADGARISLALGDRALSSRMPLVTWTEATKPANLGTLTFALDPAAKARGFGLVLDEANGLLLEQRGLVIVIR